MNNDFPNLLIISNEPLSQVSSNGRTLRNFLIGWPKDKISQFCTKNENRDFSVCENFYCVTDQDALNAFLHRKTNAVVDEKTNQGSGHGIKRNALTKLSREFIWNTNKWNPKKLYNWIDSFHPEVILFQAGDSAFMCKITYKIAKKYRIPIVIYNSENYYFKKYDYFGAKGFSHFVYPLFHKIFCKHFRKLIRYAKKSIYNCDNLKMKYDSKFHLPSETIYTATTIEAQAKDENYVQNHPLKISYLGNLGVGRHIGLIKIAQTLQKYDNTLFLDVYGKITRDNVRQAFENCEGIRYNGFVSYEEVVSIMRNSDILVHTENFDDFYKKDLEDAFSTKIADSLASGTCFILYAPNNLACTKYLKENNAAYIATNEDELNDIIKNLVFNEESRTEYIDNAIKLVERNHMSEKNCKKFQKILIDVSRS